MGRRERLLLPLAVVALGVAAVVVVVRRDADHAAERIVREDAARAAVLRVAAAEKANRERTGRYAWLDEMRTAGLLDDAAIAAPGYRLDVLLPVGTTALGGKLAPREAGTADLDLAKKRFAVVARPTEPGTTGYRTYYLDEREELYVADGVTDPESLEPNPLPDKPIVIVSDDVAIAGRFWHRSP